MSISIRKIHYLFVGEVSGVDLTKPLSSEEVASLHSGMDEHGVLVFHDQQLTDEQQIAFSINFGPIEDSTGGNPTQKEKRLDDRMNDVSNLKPDGMPFAHDDRRRFFNLGNHLWHTDSSFRTIPAKYSLLSARQIPDTGGNTQFADMRAAYDALEQEKRDQIEDLICEHSLIHSRAKLGFTEWSEDELAMMRPVRQAMVRTHPASKRKSIYIASHAGNILGWEEPEAKLFLSDMVDYATQERFVYTHDWRQWDLVMWDNRCVLHRVRNYDPTKVRDMRRTTVAGDEITTPQ